LLGFPLERLSKTKGEAGEPRKRRVIHPSTEISHFCGTKWGDTRRVEERSLSRTDVLRREGERGGERGKSCKGGGASEISGVLRHKRSLGGGAESDDQNQGELRRTLLNPLRPGVKEGG